LLHRYSTQTLFYRKKQARRLTKNHNAQQYDYIFMNGCFDKESGHNGTIVSSEISMYLTSDTSVRHILIVEDSAFEQRMLVDLLSELPYRVSVAFNGEDGYREAIAQQPDLILLDVRMPSMDGFTCCRLLKANPLTQSIPIIFLSGADAMEDRVKGLSVGAADFVTKPFTPGALAARIHTHLLRNRS
jgi:PleD family two-component response regulator